MDLIEVRDLDGPNLFALRPVIKLEVRLDRTRSFRLKRGMMLDAGSD